MTALRSKSKGLFITLEGGEGSGKSTLLSSLAKQLRQNGHDVVTTREPGGSKLGETIRHLLLHRTEDLKIGAKAELLLFLAARAQHIEELIKPSLEEGKIVLCDRFNDSTVAYQGAARGLDLQETANLCRLVCGKIEPQLTLFLDVDPREGLHRTKHLAKEQSKSGEFDRIESEQIEFHEKVRQAFKHIAKLESKRVHCIDANKSQEAVLQEALNVIDSLLTQK